MSLNLRISGTLALAVAALGAPSISSAQCSSAPAYSGPQDVGSGAPPAPTGPAPTGPTPTGPTPAGPTPTGPRGNGPVTPGPRGPVTPRGRGPRTPRGGIVIPMTRQITAKSILDVDWDFPVATAFEAKSTKTYAATASFAWPVEKAFAKIAGDDPRPLLVMRECEVCKGSEHALFSRRLNNEKTQLLLNWFHCVKLPPEVRITNHPFHNLFKSKQGYCHLFIATADGGTKVPFNGSQPQSLLQRQLTKLIGIAYKKKPKPAIDAMMRCLAQFDTYDLREAELLRQADLAREAAGPKAAAVKKLEGKLAKVRREKAKAMKRAKAVCDLKLKISVSKKPAKPAKAAAKGS